ncbi:MAG TPA: transcriptional regulator [Rectinemataceae bacterium]|nr:transcriptional regulator [Rectinemataceae bacterium]
MANTLINSMVEQDFYKAHTKALLSRISHIFKPSEEDLLPFDVARKLLRPEGEVYTGLATVPLEKIVGSEGRYRDFNRHFLPRKEHLKQRWVSIDKTYYQDIILPPVRLYEMGGIYFVRDGNHRVSVARSLGQLEIDAEVTSLQAKIELSKDMSLDELRAAVIGYEKKQFFDETRYLAVVGVDDLNFSEPGRYDTIREHIDVHKYYLNEKESGELEFSSAMLSWHENVFLPIVLAIGEENILPLFPGRTSADLYLFLVQHWDELKHMSHKEVGIGAAARDFKSQTIHRNGPRGNIVLDLLREIWGKIK